MPVCLWVRMSVWLAVQIYILQWMCAVPAEELSLMSGSSSALRQQLSQAQQTHRDQQLQIQRYTEQCLFNVLSHLPLCSSMCMMLFNYLFI